MALPLPQPKNSQNIFDVLHEMKTRKQFEQGNEYKNQLANYLAQIKQAEAQYAPQMAEQDLRKVQLANQMAQIEAQYAPQMAQGRLANLLGNVQNINLRNEYLPLEKKALIEKYNRQGSAASQLNRGGSTVSKLNYEISMANEGLDPISGQHFRNDADKAIALQSLRSSLDKQVLDPSSYKFLTRASSIENTLIDVPIQKISKFFGPKGRALAAAGATDIVSGRKNQDYEDYLIATRQTFPAAAAQMRQALEDSVQKFATQKYENLINPNYWMTNPDFAIKQYRELLNIFKREKAARLKSAPKNGVFAEQNEEYLQQEHRKFSREDAFNEIRGLR